MTEAQQQLARLRAALDKLGAETDAVRTPEADRAFYACFGPLGVLECSFVGPAPASDARAAPKTLSTK